jgi:hypothetical protein
MAASSQKESELSSLKAAYELFGDDSDDSGEDDVTTSWAHPEARTNGISVGRQKTGKSEIPLDMDEEKNCAAATRKQTTVTTPSLNVAPTLWPHEPPIFFSSLIDTDQNLGADVGGQRGYVAKTDIPVGTLLIEEQTLVPWAEPKNEEDHIFLSTLRKMILLLLDDSSSNTQVTYEQSLLWHMKDWYPKYIKDVDPVVLAEAEVTYKAGIEAILADFTHQPVHVHQATATPMKDLLTYEALLRTVLAMQCNGFGSGLALHCMIFNHSCQPNCIKFNPISNTSGDSSAKLTTINVAKEKVISSQVRATRDIAKGEALTISYLQPPYQSRVTRQKLLRMQFGFDCQCELCRVHEKEEEETQMDADALDSYSQVEEQRLPDIERLLKAGNGTGNDEAELELALTLALDVMSEALEILPHDHFVFLRIYSILANVTGSLLTSRSRSFKSETAVMFVRSSVEKLELQTKYLTNKTTTTTTGTTTTNTCTHMDFTSTYHDLSQGIGLLLTHSPKALFQEFPEWPNFREASKAESVFQKEYLKVKALYE